MTATQLAVVPCGPDRLRLVRAVSQLPLRAGLPNLKTWLAFQDGRLAGAAAMRHDAADAVAWVAVPEPYRRHGVGRALLDATLKSARNLGVAHCGTWQGVVDAGGWAFCEAAGFRHADTLEYFETSLAETEGFLSAYYEGARRRGGLPENLGVHRDAEVPWALFKPLLEAEFNAILGLRLGRIVTHGLVAGEWALALTLDGAPVAVTLGSATEGRVSLDAYTVAPAFRQGWAHLVCKYRLVKTLLARFPGDTRYGFSAGLAHGDTRTIARVMAQRGLCTQALKTERIYQRDLEPGHG